MHFTHDSSPSHEEAARTYTLSTAYALRTRIQAVQANVVLDLDVHPRSDAGANLLTLCTAAHQRQRVWMRYQNKTQAESERAFDCYGIVYHGDWW